MGLVSSAEVHPQIRFLSSERFRHRPGKAGISVPTDLKGHDEEYIYMTILTEALHCMAPFCEPRTGKGGCCGSRRIPSSNSFPA